MEDFFDGEGDAFVALVPPDVELPGFVPSDLELAPDRAEDAGQAVDDRAVNHGS
jgi:hypothetical protein